MELWPLVMLLIVFVFVFAVADAQAAAGEGATAGFEIDSSPNNAPQPSSVTVTGNSETPPEVTQSIEVAMLPNCFASFAA